MTEDQIIEILLNKAKTKKLIRRVKNTHPDKWQRVYRNVYIAYEELRKHYIQKSFFLIGVYDCAKDACWPWHFNDENGIYLSSKFRLCKISKAAQFESIKDARQHFHSWAGKKNYKMEVIEFKKQVAVPYESAILNEDSWQNVVTSLNVVSGQKK